MRGQQAVALLHDLGYSNVRDYRGGIADWVESGQPTESVTDTPPPEPDPRATMLDGPPLAASPDGVAGRGPARLSTDGSIRQVDAGPGPATLHLATVRHLDRDDPAERLLLLAWLRLSASTGWSREASPVGADLKGFASAIYFSFVTATSIGYGDIVPVGGARVIAVAEAIAALLIFGAVVAKFVSHRQDELVSEIHRITFEERLDRVETNLHMVISEMLAITAMCEAKAPLNRISTRLESAAILFSGELRTTRDLLYQPRLAVEEGVLGGILASLASALNVLSDLLACLPPGFSRSQPTEITLERLTVLAKEICGECVPHSYTPRLVFWMDRIQAAALRLK